jgi:PucR-like helix-turn-helix protein/diguanylate cyclase with GGDEF domain
VRLGRFPLPGRRESGSQFLRNSLRRAVTLEGNPPISGEVLVEMARIETESSLTAGWCPRPPAGWEPVAAVCGSIFGNLSAVTERIVAAITSELPEFRQPVSVLSSEDLRWATNRNVAGFCRGLAERRPPHEEEIGFRRLVGRQSAIRDLSLDALIASFHVSYRELWSLLVEEAEDAGGAASSQLLEGGSIVWEWMLATTQAVTEGYHHERAQRQALEARASAHFIETLVQDPTSDECVSLAEELGFRPDGTFRVLALAGPVASENAARTIVVSLKSAGATTIHTQRGNTAVIVAQGVIAYALKRALVAAGENTQVGTGLEGEGLTGARSSLFEAERALGLAVLRGRPCRFEDDWFSAILVSHRESLGRMLSSGMRTAGSHPHLADAVRAFADAAFSVAESARRLDLSQNSVRYRLRRWKDLTGSDPLTYEGLIASMMSLELAEPRPTKARSRNRPAN